MTVNNHSHDDDYNPAAESLVATPGSDGLTRSLKNRHIQMIALGGAIGTGLFYGSSDAIKLAGPGIILAYLIGGLFIYWIICMLGEMATQEPVSGSFSHFAYRYWGSFPGFLTGWNYWLLYVLVSMAELTVVGVYVNFWWPDIPAWVTSLVILVGITAINLVNVRFFGEFEFWFTLIKIIAIIGMIALGAVLIFFGQDPTTSIANLWQYGGFLPNGVHGLLLCLVVIMFSFGGTELIGVTAGESDTPRKSIPKAVRQIMWRILIFYIGTLTVLVILYPWNQVGTDGSPFVLIFSRLGIPAVPDILNLVVLTAAISVYNSGIYSNGRMLYALSKQGNAPKLFSRLSRNHIPVAGILFSSACTLVVVVINYLVPNGAFMRVMSMATAAALLTWMMIVLVHLKFRRAQVRQQTELVFKSPGFPFINYLTAAFLLLVFFTMTQLPSMFNAVWILPSWVLLLYIGFKLRNRHQATDQPLNH